MKRPILVCAMFAAAAAAMGAQQANPYQGTSNPPPDDQIMTTSAPQAKPPAGKPMTEQPVVPADDQAQPAAADQPASPPQAGDDSGIVHAAPSQPAVPAMAERNYPYDPDGDIVHPHPLRPGELGEGTNIRVQLKQRLSTVSSRKGETFRTVVASDVLQGGQVVIPAGAEIDGRVTQVSSGHAGGHGFMRLQPETVILPGGSRFLLHALTTATPGSRTRIGSEGAIKPDSPEARRHRVWRSRGRWSGNRSHRRRPGGRFDRRPDRSRSGHRSPARQPPASHARIRHHDGLHAHRAAGYGRNPSKRQLGSAILKKPPQ